MIDRTHHIQMWMVVEPVGDDLFRMYFDPKCPDGAIHYIVSGEAENVKKFAKEFVERFGDKGGRMTQQQIDVFIKNYSNLYRFAMKE